MNGPEPMNSVMGWALGVSAMRLGIMKSGRELSLARPSSSSEVGCLSTTRNCFASTASMRSISVISTCPVASASAQRLIEAMQSSDVTGAPSCHFRPSRSVKT